MQKKSTMQRIADSTKQMGDTLNTSFKSNKDLKVAQMSLKAYNTAISANRAMLIYKKLTGTPEMLEDFE
jgi:hypothetical protein